MISIKCPHCGVEWDPITRLYLGDHHVACPWRDSQRSPVPELVDWQQLIDEQTIGDEVI